jgi:hypothetical protein
MRWVALLGMILTLAGAAPVGAVQSDPPVAVIQGRGPQLTQAVPLSAGLAVVAMTHEGQRNFVVELVEVASGRTVELLANVIGGYQGSQALGLRDGGDFALNIQADGAWTVQVRQPPGVAETETGTFSGTGPAATPLFAAPTGLRRVTFSHSGSRNFIVQFMDAQGQRLDLVHNGIGPADGSQGVRVPSAGVYLFNVQADGAWEIRLE